MKIFAKTDIGKLREINEDCYYISDKNQNYSLCILADGMGGYNGGEVASNLAILTVKQYLEEHLANSSNNENITQILRFAVTEAHNKILKESTVSNDLGEMGTTLDICLINNKILYIAHIGDSRVYIIRNGEIRQVTTDHSFVENLIMEGTITRKEAETHPKRNMLMRALGGEVDSSPDMHIEKLEENDKILICTDGLSNMLNDNEILEIIQNNKGSAHNELVKRANKRGGRDNITVILIEGDIS